MCAKGGSPSPPPPLFVKGGTQTSPSPPPSSSYQSAQALPANHQLAELFLYGNGITVVGLDPLLPLVFVVGLPILNIIGPAIVIVCDTSSIIFFG